MAAESLRTALVRTHEWFDGHSGWSPPDPDTLGEWMADGVCRSPDDCLIPPAGVCPHGLVSWWTVLVALDRPDRPDQMTPARLIPRPERLSPARADFVAVMAAHHAAILAGRPGYLDLTSGLFAQTARTLWDRDGCCDSGCRHCPYDPA